MGRWIPRAAFHFSLRRLFVLTTAAALALVFLPDLDDSPVLRVFVTVYFLFLISWCIIVSYSVLLNIRSRRQELSDRLEEEVQQARQNHSDSDT
jgi:hypothetical protein